MPTNQTSYCYHCLSKVQETDGEFCAMCGKKHSQYIGQSFELPAGTYLGNGRYFVGKSIGGGGFGITYLGYDLKLEKKIVIKETFYNGIFHRNVNDTSNPEPLKVTFESEFSLENIMRKTKKECISLSKGEGLNNIVNVYDWFSENNTAYIITEFIDGVTLYERVLEKGRYSWEEYYAKLKPLMISLSTLHKTGIIHRDIKPHNIMIKTINGVGEEFILIDFGLARSTETTSLASFGISFSPGYSPYEQRSFTLEDGEYTDVYSIGATSYFALTGANPKINMAESIDENFPEINSMNKNYDVPENVVNGLRYALNPNYKLRCQTVNELIQYWDKTTDSENIDKNTAPVTETDSSNENNSRGNNRGMYVQISIALVLLIGIGIFLFGVIPQNNNSDKDKDNTESKVTVSETTADNENDDSTNREKNDKKNPPPKDDGENDEQSQTENVENSADDSELNDFKSNAETLNELLQEALNNEEYSSYTLDEFFDLKENPQTEDSYYRTINETNYFTVWTNNKQLVVWNDSNYQEGNSTIEYFYNSDLKEQFEYDFATKFGDVSDILEINEEYRNYLFEYTAFWGIKVTGDTKILELDQCIDRISSQIVYEAMQNSAIYANDSTDDTTSSESEITTSADYTDDGNAGLYQY